MTKFVVKEIESKSDKPLYIYEGMISPKIGEIISIDKKEYFVNFIKHIIRTNDEKNKKLVGIEVYVKDINE